jgi:hypothetical protein
MMENCCSGQVAIGIVNGLGPMVATGLRGQNGFEAPGARRTKEDTDAVREPGNLRLSNGRARPAGIIFPCVVADSSGARNW